MKKLMIIALAGCTFVMSQGVRNVVADDEESHGIPLHKLAGTYALTAQGSVALCFENTPPYPLAKCGSEDSTAYPLTILDVGAVTFDAKGNGCLTFTETDSNLPVDFSPPFVGVFHQSVKITSYDSTTGTGDSSSTNYVGGHCNGASFDSTGATVSSTATSHFVVSNNGKRIDVIATSVTNPTGAIGDFSLSGIELRE